MCLLLSCWWRNSSLATEMIKGKNIEECLSIKNSDIAAHLKLPPVKLHCRCGPGSHIARIAAMADLCCHNPTHTRAHALCVDVCVWGAVAFVSTRTLCSGDACEVPGQFRACAP